MKYFILLDPSSSQYNKLTVKLKAYLQHKNQGVVTNFFLMKKADVAIVFGTPKMRLTSLKHIKLALTCFVFGKKVVYFESPVVGRIGQSLSHKESYFRMGIGGAFSNFGFEYVKNNPRPENCLYSILPKPEKINFLGLINKERVLGIGLQIPKDNSIKGVNQKDFLKHVLYNCTGNFSKIIIRLPPLVTEIKYYLDSDIILEKNVHFQRGDKVSINDFFFEIDALVTLSSTLGVDAIMSGVPSLALDSRSFIKKHVLSSLSMLNKGIYILDESIYKYLYGTTWHVKDICSNKFTNIVDQSL